MDLRLAHMHKQHPHIRSFESLSPVSRIEHITLTHHRFSYASSDYIHNESAVGAEMVSFLLGFLDVYPQYAANPFFIVGESFGGHYVSSLTLCPVRRALCAVRCVMCAV